MVMSIEYQTFFRDRFFSKTGSVSLADNAYSLMYRTLFTMKVKNIFLNALYVSLLTIFDAKLIGDNCNQKTVTICISTFYTDYNLYVRLQSF